MELSLLSACHRIPELVRTCGGKERQQLKAKQKNNKLFPDLDPGREEKYNSEEMARV